MLAKPKNSKATAKSSLVDLLKRKQDNLELARNELKREQGKLKRAQDNLCCNQSSYGLSFVNPPELLLSLPCPTLNLCRAYNATTIDSLLVDLYGQFHKVLNANPWTLSDASRSQALDAYANCLESIARSGSKALFPPTPPSST